MILGGQINEVIEILGTELCIPRPGLLGGDFAFLHAISEAIVYESIP